MNRTNYVLTAVLLAFLTALDALTMDIGLPALPAIARGLSSSQAAVELSLSAYLLGMALGQLIQGPASDRFGRKPVLLLGLIAYAVASAACAGAGSIAALIGLRLLQGLAASAGQILARAIVRDKFARDEGARLLSFAMTGLAFAPIIAPILGSEVTEAFGWRIIFVLLAAYAATIGVLFWRFLDESNQHPRADALAPRLILTNYRIILSNRIFWSYSLCGIAAFSGLFAFLTASPGVFINTLGLEPKSYGLLFATIMIGHGIALLFGATLVRRFGLDRLLRVGVSLLAVSGAAAAGLGWAAAGAPSDGPGAWTDTQLVASIAIPVAVYMVAFALTIPQTIAGAMAPFADKAGAAASLMGFLQFAGAAATATLISLTSDASQFSMVTAIGLTGLFGLIFWFLLVRPIAEFRRYQ